MRNNLAELLMNILSKFARVRHVLHHVLFEPNPSLSLEAMDSVD